MTCPKCGAQISDDAKFCGVCGNTISQENAAPVPPQQPADNNSGAAAQPADAGQSADNGAQQSNGSNAGNGNSNNGGFQPSAYNPIPSSNDSQGGSNVLTEHLGQIIVGVGAVVVLIILIVIFSAVFGGGYKTPIKDTVKFLNKRSTDVEDYRTIMGGWGAAASDYTMLSAKLSAEAYDDDFDEDEWLDDVADSIEDLYDTFDDEYGDDWKISYKIKKASKLSDSKLEDYQDEWEDYLDDCADNLEYMEDNDDYDSDGIEDLEKLLKKMEKKEVTKGYKLKVQVTIKGDDDDDKETTTMYVLKIGGDWVLYNSLF